MSISPEILEMGVKNEGPRDDSSDKHDDLKNPAEGASKHAMEKVVETHHARLMDAARLANLGLAHFLLVLELITPKHLNKQQNTQHSGARIRDEEVRGERLSPGEDGFASRFERELHGYLSRRNHLHEELASIEAFSTSGSEKRPSESGSRMLAIDADVRLEFSLILYLGHLQDDLVHATLPLVQFADRKFADGMLKRRRLIFPKQKSVRAWLSLSNAKEPDNKADLASKQSSQSTGFHDPEHLPPENFWGKLRYSRLIIQSSRCNLIPTQAK